MLFSFHVEYELAEKKSTINSGIVYGMFGLKMEQGKREYVKPFQLDIKPGEIVLFSGTSGGGKTSCLRQMAEQANGELLDYHKYKENTAVIDHFSDVKRGMYYLGICGLSEAQLYFRYPSELSDGQKYRFAIAMQLYKGNKILLCDEFLATLDRTTAKVIAYNLRKIAIKENIIIGLATTHTDIIDDLQPEHIVLFENGEANIHRCTVKKNEFLFTTLCKLQ